MPLDSAKKILKKLTRFFLFVAPHRKHQNSLNFLEAMSFPTFWMDKNKVYQGGNQIFANLMGISDPNELVGLKDENFSFSPEILEKRNQIFDDILSGRASNCVLYDSIINTNGQTIWAQKRFSVLKNSDGEIFGIAGIIIDISERVSRRKETDDLLKRKKLFSGFFKEFAQTNLNYQEITPVTHKLINLLQDIYHTDLIIWFNPNAKNLNDFTCHVTNNTDTEFDILELFTKREYFQQLKTDTFLDRLAIKGISETYSNVDSAYVYPIKNLNGAVNIHDVLLFINPDKNIEIAQNAIFLAEMMIKNWHIQKCLDENLIKKSTPRKAAVKRRSHNSND